jgi:hypothetical protein
MSALSVEDPYRFASHSEYLGVIDKIHAEEGIRTQGGLASAAMERNEWVDYDERAKILLSCLDEFQAYFILIAFKLAANPTGTKDYKFAMGRLMSAFVSNLEACRVLVRRGLYLPLGQLCRPLYEIANITALSRMDDHIHRDFVKSLELKEANAFWHKNIAKKRDTAAIDKAMSGIVDRKALLFESYNGNLDEYLGAFVHPSMLSASLATTHDLAKLIPGAKSDGSPQRFLYYILNQCFRVLAIAFGNNKMTECFHNPALDELMPTDTEKIGKSCRSSLFSLYLITLARLWAVK